jgi:hypothetical protein
MKRRPDVGTQGGAWVLCVHVHVRALKNSAQFQRLPGRCTGIPSNDDVEGGVRGAVGGILLEPLQWHQLLTPRGWKRLTTEGHTFADAILTVAMAQIGTFRRCMRCVPI